MIDAVRELEENIKRERYERAWHQIGKIMVWVSLMVILATIVMVVMDERERETAMEETNLFIRGVERLVENDYKGALPIFKELSEHTDSKLYPLALLRLAQAEMGIGDTDATVRTFKTLSETETVFSDLGQMMLPPVNGDVPKPFKASPFFHTLSEVRGWRLIGMTDNYDNGIAQLLALYQDERTPLSMRIRVTEALQELAPERLFKVDAHMKAKRLNAQKQAELADKAEEK